MIYTNDMMLVKGPGSPILCDRLAERLDTDVVDVDRKIFPDGEHYVRLLGDVDDEDCVLVQANYPDDNLLELFLIQDAIFENGASSLVVVVPYFSYGRQDKRFRAGEPVSARAISRLIEARSDSFFSIDLHSKKALDFFTIPAANLSAMPLLADHARSYDPDILLSPDEGGKERVKLAAKDTGIEWDYLIKERLDGETVKMEPKGMRVEGKTVVILDDIISTGGTMVEAARQLFEQGVEEVHAGCTHGLFVGDSLKRLEDLCDSVFCTDTVECESSEVTVAPLILCEIYGIE